MQGRETFLQHAARGRAASVSVLAAVGVAGQRQMQRAARAYRVGAVDVHAFLDACEGGFQVPAERGSAKLLHELAVALQAARVACVAGVAP